MLIEVVNDSISWLVDNKIHLEVEVSGAGAFAKMVLNPEQSRWFLRKSLKKKVES